MREDIHKIERGPILSWQEREPTCWTMEGFLSGVRAELLKVSELGTEGVWSLVAAIAVGGKQLRPKFIYNLFCKIADPSVLPEALIKEAAGIELLHTSTLIHDDVIDRSSFRRGLPTVNKQHGPEVAILVANLLKDRALTSVSPGAERILNKASYEINLGQLWETQLRGQEGVTVSDVLLISLYKAGRIFRHGIEIVGRYVARDIPKELTSAIELVAMVYQAADDWLDLAANEDVTNKESGRDRVNNVPSFMSAEWKFKFSRAIGGRHRRATASHEQAREILIDMKVPLRCDQQLMDLPLLTSRRYVLAFACGARQRVRRLTEKEPAVFEIFDDLISGVETRMNSVWVDGTAHFNHVADHFQDLQPPSVGLIDRLGSLLCLTEGAQLIDVGCGTGADLVLFRERFQIEPIGIDISERMCEQAVQQLGERRVHCAEAAKFLKDNARAYDAALLKFSSHHFPDMEVLLSAVFSSLRASGRVAIVTMMPEQVHQFTLVEYFPTLRGLMLAAASKQAKITTVLERVGFEKRCSSVSTIAQVPWDLTILTKIRERFISFLEAVPNRELSAGLRELEADLRKGNRSGIFHVKGQIIAAERPASIARTGGK